MPSAVSLGLYDEDFMSKNGISYMLREVIVQSGASSQSGQAPRAHSIRGIATSSTFFRNWSLRSVL